MKNIKIYNKNIVRIITIIITILTMASCTEEPKVINQGINNNNNMPSIVYDFIVYNDDLVMKLT